MTVKVFAVFFIVQVLQLYTSGSNSHLWSTNETTSSITAQPTTTTTYTVDVTSGSTTCTSDPTTITVQPLPTVDLGNDVEICNGAFQTLDAGTHSSYLWSTGDTVSSIFVSPSVNTSYWLTQTTNGFSCSDTINVFVSCLEFTPTVSVALSNLNCGLTDLIISVSQDSNEVDMDSATFLSDAGSFTISSIRSCDVSLVLFPVKIPTKKVEFIQKN
mgnify:CR=1 FL=1